MPEEAPSWVPSFLTVTFIGTFVFLWVLGVAYAGVHRVLERRQVKRWRQARRDGFPDAVYQHAVPDEINWEMKIVCCMNKQTDDYLFESMPFHVTGSLS